ncbi:inositol-3-phosphate synthase [Parvularcula maris]|uniref:Inositol-3-phosphate synthase n=1 Tax=Parvularcula maris TaxID=2965077 RepID=A0A9X2L9A6_9PROT|nr:inositol-3-phosphate synthase [Parvularcula maris]MCQ8185483.1 inositol-3-phosphate synthase [Parvularcula maris]
MASQLGVAIIGLSGQAASAAVATVELARRGRSSRADLPLGDRPNLAPYSGFRFAGWDMKGGSVLDAAFRHEAVDPQKLGTIEAALRAVKPWPALTGDGGAPQGCSGEHKRGEITLRERIECIQDDLDRFRQSVGGRAVAVNLSTPDFLTSRAAEAFQSRRALEEALDQQDRKIGPAMLYAYAAIDCGVPFVDFTESPATCASSIIDFAIERGVPLAGRPRGTEPSFHRSAEAAPLVIEVTRLIDYAAAHGARGTVETLSQSLGQLSGLSRSKARAELDIFGSLKLWLREQEARADEDGTSQAISLPDRREQSAGVRLN